MLPFCRQLMKTVSRQLSTGQHHQACKSLTMLAKALAHIRIQRRFKTTVLLVSMLIDVEAVKHKPAPQGLQSLREPF